MCQSSSANNECDESDGIQGLQGLQIFLFNYNVIVERISIRLYPTLLTNLCSPQKLVC